MSGIGHNSGREPATAWRVHCWREARRALLPTLPLEVIRTRIRRAGELGLPYSTYAAIRATSGQDIVAFLFSSNALGILRPEDAAPPRRAAKLAALEGCDRLALAQPPLRPEALSARMAAARAPLAACAPAPAAFAPWGEIAAAIRAARGRLPADGVLLVAETALEREWCAAGRLAGVLPAERYFAVT